MPRGKNYVNQNKGMRLQAPKNGAVIEQCRYGKACNRSDCIYRHDTVEPQSNDPCLMYIAGFCHFDAKTCKKRHPDDQEVQRLKIKYAKIPCRFGKDCQTNHCLYLHDLPELPKKPVRPSNATVGLPTLSAFPPLGAEPPLPKNGDAFPPLGAAPQATLSQPPPSSLVQSYPQQQQIRTAQPSMLRPEAPGIQGRRPSPQFVPYSPSAVNPPSAASLNKSAKEFVPGKGFTS